MVQEQEINDHKCISHADQLSHAHNGASIRSTDGIRTKEMPTSFLILMTGCLHRLVDDQSHSISDYLIASLKCFDSIFDLSTSLLFAEQRIRKKRSMGIHLCTVDKC